MVAYYLKATLAMLNGLNAQKLELARRRPTAQLSPFGEIRQQTETLIKIAC